MRFFTAGPLARAHGIKAAGKSLSRAKKKKRKISRPEPEIGARASRAGSLNLSCRFFENASVRRRMFACTIESFLGGDEGGCWSL